MKRSEFKYIAILAVFFIGYVLFQLFAKKPYDWTQTLRSDDKNPFGTYVLDESLSDLFSKVNKSTYTIYELQDTSFNGMMILCNEFYLGEEDLNTLLQRADSGAYIFISAFDFGENLKDTLDFDIADVEFSNDIMDENLNNDDSLSLRIEHPDLNDDRYKFPIANTYSQFQLNDSSAFSVLAYNNQESPVTLFKPFGKGAILLNCTPLAFSNHFMLQNDNHRFVSGMLSWMPAESIHWTEYYQNGRLENPSPLRYIMRNEALTWSYYLIIAGILLFIIFEAKRRQRIIPVIPPLRNTSLDFVRTISSLYFEYKDHKNIADKRISYFLEKMRKAYYLPDYLQGKALYEKVAAKSGRSFEDVEILFNTMYTIRSKSTITEDELKRLNTLIENFTI